MTPSSSMGTGGPLLQLLRTASAAYERGDLDRAEASCRQLLGMQPGQADALHILGLSAWRHGRRDEAVAHIREAIAGQPRKPQPHNSLGVMLRELGESMSMAEGIASPLCRIADRDSAAECEGA